MSVLDSIPNIKVPYPTEGVIRTAQLDDTVAPDNSVQLAVNMNFDRVGAMQTRPGITQYADDLVNAIQNYGSLRNNILPPGYEQIFQLGGKSQLYNNEFGTPAAVKISNTKIAVFWTDENGKGQAQNFALDEVTGTITPLGTAVEFDATANVQNKAIAMGSDLVINVWQRSGAAYAAGFDCSSDQIVAGTAYNFDSSGFHFSLALVDPTHAICFYGTVAGFGLATAFALNTTTLAITEPGSTLTFEASGSNQWNSCSSISSLRILNVWSASGVPSAQTFLVNNSTWAITAVGSGITFGSTGLQHNVCSLGDGVHYIDIYRVGGVTLGGQTLAVNAGTFAVATIGAALSGGPLASQDLTAVSFGDGSHVVAFFAPVVGQGKVQMIEAAASTYNLSFVGNQLSGYDFNTPLSGVPLLLESHEVAIIWGGSGGTGEAAVFQTFGQIVHGQFLYAGTADEVFNTTNGTWVSRRSGLASVSKPRFAQYLNLEWMVNGNEQIGGDPVATSDGGSFGNTLVPENFPAGDFIQAGFEGRVWVGNKTMGVIYYTDIVQFVPPATYILTYNPDVNFISQLTPQTGQSLTAMFTVPRALLVFTEDTIYRIYGASSVDAYPAYNVGTFSQESIIQTKTGIFFHHSSGFYQFDYGSQPVEISRRIIDFVKAIPRANYDDIVGVWDGFDNVEWWVGSVLVEGVVFGNCVVRYTISTQVWTIYDYTGNQITAMIYYDDGVTLNHLVAATNTVDPDDTQNKTGALDTGTTDFGQPFYFEFIDRWRSFSTMYYTQKQISGINVYSENAAGANLKYQEQKTGPNAWEPLGTVSEANNALMPNAQTESFDVIRLRLSGTTEGVPVIVHGIEILSLNLLGQDEN